MENERLLAKIEELMKQRGYIFTGKQSISITEQKGRVEGIGKQFAALGRRNRKNGMHDILIDNHALSDLQGYLAVIVINNGRAFFHQKYLNFRMPVPANPVHIGTVQIHIGNVNRIFSFPGKAYALISLFLYIFGIVNHNWISLVIFYKFHFIGSVRNIQFISCVYICNNC